MSTDPSAWEAALGAVVCCAAFYAYARMAFVWMERRRYNQTHRRKMWTVTMCDIPEGFLEFFALPFRAVRWLSSRRRKP